MNWKVPLFKIYWDKSDVDSVASVIRSGMRWAEGPSIKEFERGIAKYTGAKYCLAFSSGTSALHAVMLAYGIGKGDEVIVPSFTFISTANTPLFTGARSVFSDIEEEAFGLDPRDVEKKITKKTKAIIAVHYAGCPCKIEALTRIAKKHNLVLIEDTAEAFGAKVKNKYAGTFGNIGVFSFCQNKIISTGEGGAIITDSKDIYKRLKLIRSHGRDDKVNYFSSDRSSDYVGLGYNFRMPSAIAALGISQLKKIGEIVKKRRANARYMNKALKECAAFLETPGEPKGFLHVYQMYTVRVPKSRDALKKYLASKGIMTKVYFDPVHLTRFYKNTYKDKKELPITERLSREILTLPMHPGLSKREMDYIAKSIKQFFKGVKNAKTFRE